MSSENLVTGSKLMIIIFEHHLLEFLMESLESWHPLSKRSTQITHLVYLLDIFRISLGGSINNSLDSEDHCGSYSSTLLRFRSPLGDSSQAGSIKISSVIPCSKITKCAEAPIPVWW